MNNDPKPSLQFAEAFALGVLVGSVLTILMVAVIKYLGYI